MPASAVMKNLRRPDAPLPSGPLHVEDAAPGSLVHKKRTPIN